VEGSLEDRIRDHKEKHEEEEHRTTDARQGTASMKQTTIERNDAELR
jgi:hypothetical protein